MLMAACIKDFNAKQTTKNRTSSDERDAILNLLQQTDQFRQTPGTHCRISLSCIPLFRCPSCPNLGTKIPTSRRSNVQPTR